MKKGIYLLLFMLTGFLPASNGQDSNYVQQNAIRIDRQDSLGKDIYKAISNYTIFLVGENHGTKEPAQFVGSLTDLLIKNGNHVQIGLEIPTDWMKAYIASPTDSNIYSSKFFTKKSNDGRATFTWAALLSKLKSDKTTEIFFYDGNGDSDEYKNFIHKTGNLEYADRDSLMYLKIKKRILLHPNWKTITLSGNVHNMLIPKDSLPTMGYYLANDKDLKADSIKTFSVVHNYASGTMLSDWGDGLQIQPIDHASSLFATAVNYENYLLLLPMKKTSRYSGIYFTRQITAATLVNKNNK